MTTYNREDPRTVLPQLEKSINEKIDLLKVDYIVEQGTNNEWTYKKWNSGTVEAWCTTTQTVNTGDWTTSGSMYYTAYKYTNALGFNVIDAHLSATSMNLNYISSIRFDNDTRVSFRFIRGASVTAQQTYTAYITVRGKWK